MEIGTEISKKIRAAIKGKLQELGAYVDEELPDYIMVMVANKKSAQQMADDLSLFLGSNTFKFTVWLHGVLEKLRTAAVEPAPLHSHHHHSDTNTTSRDERKGGDSRALAVSSSRSDKLEGRVSSSAHEHYSRRGSSDRSSSSSRLTSAVKPMIESVSAEPVIDIKPDLEDDDLIADLGIVTTGKIHSLSSRSSMRSSGRAEESYRPSEALRGHERSGSSYGRSYRESSSKEEMSRKRKAPVASSVVRIKKSQEQLQESDDNEDEEDYSLPSHVSLPAKPERKPTLPPAKQANKNLILKAISEAQESINKTTAVYTISQRQTVPVAPRTRSANDEMNRAALRLVQEHLQAFLPREPPPSRQTAQSRPVSSRLQQEFSEETQRSELVAVSEQQQQLEASRLKALDTRSFIMRRPELEQTPSIKSRLGAINPEEVPVPAPRTIQTREKLESSPKFIVTLDGVPSPLAGLTEQDMDVDDTSLTTPDLITQRLSKPAVHLNVTPDHPYEDDNEEDYDGGDGEIQEEEEMELEQVSIKKQKVAERCRFWPACKSGDQCLYHHPTTPCRTFPTCVFGEKCLYIHPNCKYDAKCSKPDCPYTHISHRAVPPPSKPVPTQSSSVCRFFPECKRTDCTFYHPKPCRFAAHCHRAGCAFYHPTAPIPPRHALKWTKAQSS